MISFQKWETYTKPYNLDIVLIFVCLVIRFQRHVHTYRVLPDADGLLAVQVSCLYSKEKKSFRNTHSMSYKLYVAFVAIQFEIFEKSLDIMVSNSCLIDIVVM